MSSKLGSEKCHGAESNLQSVKNVEKNVEKKKFDSYKVVDILDLVDSCESVENVDSKTTEMKKTLNEKILISGDRKKQIKPSDKKCDPLRRLREQKLPHSPLSPSRKSRNSRKTMPTEKTPGNCRENSKNSKIKMINLNEKKISSLIEYFEILTGAKTTEVCNGVGGVGTYSKHSSAASGIANDKSEMDHVTSQGEIKPIGGGHVEHRKMEEESQWTATTDSA